MPLKDMYYKCLRRFNLNENPKVSIIIPTHNHAHFLSECLASVKSQTYKDYEVIVVNNGSTDNTEEIVRKLAWDQLRYKYQNDTGSVAGPRNTGISLAKGKYVAFLDSDDLWYEKKIEKVMNIFEKKSEIDIISHDLYMTKKGKIKLVIKSGPLSRNMFKSLLIKNCVSGSAAVVRKETLIEAGGFDESKEFIHAEDSEIWLRIAYLGKNFYFINEVLGEYRAHETNLSNDFVSVLNNEKNVIKKHYNKLRSPVPFHKHFLYQNRLSRIYFKISIQYFFRKKYLKCAYNLILSFFSNPFYFPFNILLLKN